MITAEPRKMAERTTLGKNLKAFREAKKLSQKALAEAVDLSTSLIAQIEQGVITDPRISSVIKIAKALGVSLDELMAEPSDGQSESLDAESE
jgi:transcriptional regulator with XRE-family HTH domain